MSKINDWLEKDKKNFIVYIHIFPNKKVYIGITCQKPNERWRNGKGYKKSQIKIRNAIKKYGWENIEHKILYIGLSKEEAEQKEIELIGFYKSNQKEYGYNIENGGNCIGTHSKETLKKMSANRKGKCCGKENSFYGKHHSEETKKNLSELAKKRKHAKETKNKIALSGMKKIIQCNKNGEEIKVWNSIKEAGKRNNICQPSISACAKGKRKSAGGYIWKYYGDVYG